MAAIHIEAVAVPPQFHAVQVKCGRFPIGADGAKLRAFLAAVLQSAAAGGLNQETFFQNEYLANGRDIVNPHLPEWVPQVGLGVWPDRPPPELWKVSDMFKMARGERVPLMYQVSRVSAGPKASSQALQLLLGTGMTMSILHA